LYTGWPCEVLAFRLTNSPLSGRGHGHVTSLNFDNISEMVQEGDIVAMED